MATTFDPSRLSALVAELDVLKGPFGQWKRLPYEDIEVIEIDEDSDEEADSNEDQDEEGGLDDEESDDYEDEDEGEDDSDDDNDEYYNGIDKYDLKARIVQRILRDLSTLVRESQDCSDIDELLPKVESVVDRAGKMACSGTTAMDKSWSHSDQFPMLKGDPFHEGTGNYWQELGQSFQSFMSRQFGEEHFNSLEGTDFMKRPIPWSETFRPHPLSTKFARFKDDVEITPSHDQPIASAVYTARCEILESSAIRPCFMEISSDAKVLIRGYVGGSKNSVSMLKYYLLQGDTVDQLPRAKGFEGSNGDPGHRDHFTQQCFEETRKLFFTAEPARIKSFQWGPLPKGSPYPNAFPVHTFKSGEWDGPITTVAAGEGKLIRAGKGSAGVWNLDSAPTHGEDGEGRIGDRLDKKDAWRSDKKNIEGSAGSPHDATITFQDPKFKPSIWKAHPSQAGVMLAGMDYENTKRFAFHGLDLETGNIVQRYIGHGGAVQQISTVGGQPQTFTTACLDGFVRLWDTRTPMPILTIQVGHVGCTAAAYANPDGIPTIFTGAGREENIRLWDIRARTPVYELATGNNAVQSLAWDATRHHLWAATTSDSRMHGLRPAQVPPGQETDWDEDRKWPTRAYQFEDYYGTMYDAGGSALFRYAFREAPDPTIHPVNHY